MSTKLATYSFLPWVRQGMGRYITQADGDQTLAERASVQINVQIRGKAVEGGGDVPVPISKPVQLYGPGDIIGLDQKAIVRVEPRPSITNFESNYLPFVEFYDEDLPWRYTPAQATGNRLRPWLVLLVLEEGEFEDGTNLLNRPLPFVVVSDPASKFPAADTLWAWAHVHVNSSLDDSSVLSTDTAALGSRLSSLLAQDRDHACARLLSPRILKPDTSYTAFLMPSFELGRLAGLGLDPAQAPFATFAAWDSYPSGTKAEPEHFPYYHRWSFRTGSLGDFEYLVRLLKPQPADPRVGVRDMDVRDPQAGLPGIDTPGLDGILRLGGALRVPEAALSSEALAERARFEQWDAAFPTAFQEALAQFINLADTYEVTLPADANAATSLAGWQQNDPDPLITPPLYGRWHAAVSRLLEDRDGNPLPNRDNWIHRLNLDPRYRVPAALGTGVVQHNQEDYMLAAWEQVGDVLKANMRIDRAILAAWASKMWHRKHLAPMQEAAPQQFLMLSAPVHRRVMHQGLTLRFQTQESTVPAAVLSKPFRQALRSRGRLGRKVFATGGFTWGGLLDRINRGEVSAAPPRTLSPNLPANETIRETLDPGTLPKPVVDLMRRYPWLRWALIALIILLALILFLFSKIGGSALGAGLLLAAWWLFRKLEQVRKEEQAKDWLDPARTTPEAVDRLPSVADLQLSPLGDRTPVATGGRDGEVARRFKLALKDQYALQQEIIQLPVQERQPLDLGRAAADTLQQLEPLRTIPARVQMQVFVPGHFMAELVESFDRIMAYPRIDKPMYEPLKDLGAELFLPNIQRIPPNSITLLETNQPFIEAYMVGLNHEFSRELLWREYPTDQRGSYFRQFWDPQAFLPAPPSPTPDALREQLYDIPEIHRWRRNSRLGDHDHREAPGDNENELVLTIRGELLKKYPNAVIYAQKAEWERKADGTIDKSKPRRLATILPAEAEQPPRTKLKTPLYEAKVEPDITFFGFDLTDVEAKGGPSSTGGEEAPGWFFVIKERPGDPRFGLDLPLPSPRPPSQALHTWNDLSWTDVVHTLTPGTSLVPGERQVTLADPGNGTSEEAQALKRQYDEDSQFRWRSDTHAAEMAYILYQVPVLMAIHASEML